MLPGVTEIAAVPPTPARRRRRIRWDVLLPALVLLGVVLLSTFPSLVTDADPQSCQLGRSLEAPSAAHPFGFSVFGCDYLAESIYASRTSLTIAALTVVGTTLIALVLGSGAGFYGGWVDVLVSRFTDVWTAVPLLLGAIVVLSALRVRGVLTVSLVLIVFGWPAMVRLQRASVQEAAAHEYVTALRPLLSYASAYAGLVIGIEATLTYVGVGLQQPVLSWGQLLLQAQDRLSQAPHLIVPAFMLVLVVSSLVLLAQGLRRAADPLEG
jgi:oligopeptide transport system permease protein